MLYRHGSWILCAAVLLAVLASSADAQTRRKAPAKKPAPKAPAIKTVPVEMKCPAVLGTGVNTKRLFCDVISGVNPAEGVILPIPPRTGSATLTFDLHNRHTYSETETKSGKGFARYTATVIMANLKGEVLGRATVLSEFRGEKDLFDRVTGGAGPGGVKAVAPTGVEAIVFDVPEDVSEVVLLGERLVVQRATGREVFTAAGRPMAIVSSPVLEYRPKPAAPAKKPTTRRR